jgi:malonate decarboxylase alpha subunit
MFVGSTLQIDKYGNSSTATTTRIAGFGGAPNIGCDAPGRRHSSPAWSKAGAEFVFQQNAIGSMPRGKKLVVQVVETFADGMRPTFVDELDAWQLAKNSGFAQPPVMIYSDHVTHIVSEIGIAELHKCADLSEKTAAIRAIAGFTSLGMRAIPDETDRLRKAGIVKTPEDLGIDPADADRSLLAAQDIRDLVKASKGLYDPPARFRNW